MYITNVIDYDNMTDEFNNTLSLKINCTNIEKNNDLIIPT